jgi:FtsZ-binding cell division protein ZapB
MALTLPSCKAKYLELQAQVDKARRKKLELEKENRDLKKSNTVLADSLKQLIQDYEAIKPVAEQFISIAEAKKAFLKNRLPYYLSIKQRQALNTRKK